MSKAIKRLYIDCKYEAMGCYPKPVPLFLESTDLKTLENELIEYDEVYITTAAVSDFGSLMEDYLDQDGREILGIGTEDDENHDNDDGTYNGDGDHDRDDRDEEVMPRIHLDDEEDEPGYNERIFETIDYIDSLSPDDTLVIIDTEDDMCLCYSTPAENEEKTYVPDGGHHLGD